MPACRQVSTKPRHGVGLNDLLGGKEAGEGETLAHLPKGRSPDAWARPKNFPLDLSEVTAAGATTRAESGTVNPKLASATHVLLSAQYRAERSGNEPRMYPKRSVDRSR